MKNFLKGKIGTVIILLATFVLAGVAIFTAIRLYQLRSQPVAPNVPSSMPNAQELNPTAAPSTCNLSFSISVSTGTPTTTPTATATGTPNGSATPTPTATVTPTGSTTAPTPTPTPPSLPQSGTDWPTIVGAGLGVFVIIGSLLLAL